MKQKPAPQILHTPYEAQLPEIPWKEYPRLQLRRDSFFCLNGEWELFIRRDGEAVYDGKILVPFPVESRLSGVERRVEKRDLLCYRKTFTLPEGFQKDRIILHFGAVDQFCRVFLNGALLGEHTGGYLPFSFDLTPALLPGENQLRVEVTDPLDRDLPWGKQTETPGGMWYTPVSGIWQTVWLESVAEEAIANLTVTPLRNSVTIRVEGGLPEKVFSLKAAGMAPVEIPFTGDTLTFYPEVVRNWYPEDPYLYDFEIRSGQDRVASYFALRTVEVSGREILLNGRPIYFHGVLDQGYYPDGIYLPATPEGYVQDIRSMQALGFNTLRKHIKIEPEQFYYHCDRLGMLVFQDFVNSGNYSFFLDTALPTVGIKKGLVRSASPRRKKIFKAAARETIDRLYNHPCVVLYTIFNEGWGQHDADALYDFCRQLDPSRVWNTSSGWFKARNTDIQSEHVYFKPLGLKAGEKPLLVTEFGGYTLTLKEHAFRPELTYGYRSFRNQKALMEGLTALYEKQVLPAIKHQGLSGTILTQLSDVEEETNGMLTYDRQVLKVEEKSMRSIARSLYKAFAAANRKG